ncbi:MAG: serine protease [Spirochaetia bacterium]|nr:serine protease [Spirochaetia bacterium]
MKKFILINGLLLISIYNIAAQETGNGLSSLTIETINEAVYEVIVKKNEPIDVTYEKELPMHLIPYAVRNDKYISIGSAFAIESNKYVSAAHVMPIGDGSQYREVFIRDKKGNVFEIDNILNYSDHRDFVVFNLKNKKAAKFLSIDKNPVLNEKVYAVGNALGEGIVIRDGLYTSNTPEQENGEWKWIRFSAAASPGNSGGPLLNKNGKVIGIVCMKSSNENLNYALPIGEALTEKPIAISHKQIKYGLDNMSYSDYDIYHKEFNLPDTYKSLNEKFEKDTKEYTEKILKGMFNKYEKEIFPRGPSQKICFIQIIQRYFPIL